MTRGKLFVLILLFSLSGMSFGICADDKKFEVTGFIRDSLTNEPLIGATIIVDGSMSGAIAGADGEFVLNNIEKGELKLNCNFIGYKPKTVVLDIQVSMSDLIIAMAEDVITTSEVVVVGTKKTGTDLAVINQVRYNPFVSSGISSQQIGKTLDRDASEVVKRIPGITILADRFVVVRGLAQRYNNVWLGGAPTPSTEADGRVFSFDIIPSSQIDNIVIVKSPAPEIPGDFAGGFIKIDTKNMPKKNSQEISLTTGINSVTHFNKTRLSGGSKTDWLGFDNSKRPLSKGFPKSMAGASAAQITSLTKNGFNNDWSIKTKSALPDIRLSYALNNNFDTKRGVEVGVISAINYSNTYKSVLGIENSRYGIYSVSSDSPIILDDYIDNSYTNDVRVGVMHNWAFKIDGYNTIEFRNLFNQLGRNRLIERQGIKDMSSTYFIDQTEMLYNSRLSYTGQLAGSHRFGDERTNKIDWNASYSYANKREPDRRIVTNLAGISGSVVDYDMPTANDNIKRYYQRLNDNIGSLSVDYKKSFTNGVFNPELKAGAYFDFRDRVYNPREFIYRYDNLSYTERQTYLYLPYEQMLQNSWLGADKVYIDEITKKSDAYSAQSNNTAAYIAANMPVGNFNFYFGARYEFNEIRLTSDKSADPSKEIIVKNSYPTHDILPSVNMTYNISERNLIRLSYGKTLNRPEFRELSPSVYYDFELFSEVAGNENLKTAYIQNLDLRYEFYPSSGETVSVGMFYKHFRNPIEWTFIDMGGSLRYSYENAVSAQNLGVEVELRKNLDFLNLPNVTIVANGAYINSNVKFNDGGVVKTEDRSMQGQSPFIVNGGVFYQSSKLGLMANVQYNIIGKRIIGIGKSNSTNNDINTNIPDSYEMPRNVLDISVAKTIGKMFEIKLGVKDLLAQDVVFKQFPKFEQEGVLYTREQTTRRFNMGRFFSLGLTIKL